MPGHYDPVPTKERKDSGSNHSSEDISESEELIPSEKLNIRTQTRRRPWLLIAGAWLLSLSATSWVTWLYGHRLESFSAVDRIASLSWYSPIYKDIDLHVDHHIVNGTLWWDEGQVFKQDPSPETDAAWDDLIGGHANRVFVDKEDWIKMGLDPEVGAQWVGDPTRNTYMAEINAFHLLHCLDMLRKGMFMDYYESTRPVNPLYWSHQYHCLDMLRQELMCTASLDLSPLVWSEHQKMPFPYFTINRQCRRWEDIQKYRDEHQMTKEQLDLMLGQSKPPHQKEIPIPDHARVLLENIGKWKEMDPSEFAHVNFSKSDFGRTDKDGLPEVQRNPNGKYSD